MPSIAEELSSRTWLRSFDWTIEIDGLGGFFPCHEFDAATSSISSHDFELGGGMFTMPRGVGLRSVVVNFYDDDGGSNFAIIQDWYDEVADATGVARLEDIARSCVVSLGRCGKAARSFTFLISPKDDLIIHGGNDASLLSFTAQFYIVGTAD